MINRILSHPTVGVVPRFWAMLCFLTCQNSFTAELPVFRILSRVNLLFRTARECAEGMAGFVRTHVFEAVFSGEIAKLLMSGGQKLSAAPKPIDDLHAAERANHCFLFGALFARE